MKPGDDHNCLATNCNLNFNFKQWIFNLEFKTKPYHLDCTDQSLTKARILQAHKNRDENQNINEIHDHLHSTNRLLSCIVELNLPKKIVVINFCRTKSPGEFPKRPDWGLLYTIWTSPIFQIKKPKPCYADQSLEVMNSELK